MTVRVEPGVVLDQLNAHLKPLGLMFGPDVSTSDRATIGGMIGNNSAGARSLRYGKTVDHVRAVEVVLADGTTATLGPGLARRARRRSARGRDSIGAIHRVVRDTVAAARAGDPRPVPAGSCAGSAATTSTSSSRDCRSGPSGWHDEPWQFNLAKLIVGSEGTLAVVGGRRAEAGAAPGGPGAGRALVRHDPGGARSPGRDRRDRPGRRRDARPDDPRPGRARTRSIARYLNFAEGRPAAVLAAQFYADSPGRAGRARRATWPRSSRGGRACSGVRTRLVDAAKDDFWKVRKAGFSLLMGMVGDAKPIAFVEDTAVDPARLPEFYERFRADRRAARRAGGVLRPRRRRLPAHPADHQRQDRRAAWRRCGRSPAKSPTWSSSSAAR